MVKDSSRRSFYVAPTVSILNICISRSPIRSLQTNPYAYKSTSATGVDRVVVRVSDGEYTRSGCAAKAAAGKPCTVLIGE